VKGGEYIVAVEGKDPVGTQGKDPEIPSEPVGAPAPAEPVSEPPVQEPTTPEPPVEYTPEQITKMLTENKRLRAGQSTLEKKLRESSKKLTEFESQQQFKEMSPESAEQLFANPLVQKLLLQNAEYQLKEGVKEILDRYPDTPENVAKAIKANPRGFVKPGTDTVEDGLWDIEEYLTSLSGGTPATPPEGDTPTGKEFPLAATNPVTPKSTGDEMIDKLVSLIASGRKGINEALMGIEEKIYTQKQFDQAVKECERQEI